ncbi:MULTISPECIES: DUF6516 family protein [Rahnella]|jgi:hypothetical protein|uniref:toxin-antitoxin system TumE family protein n=1 Tax=Rahnella TaxID=34037 RepID=UPI0010EC4974|nr:MULTISPECIES: DUF6516 family protein [Rahnella]TCQ85732.1 hypothetical protein EC840_109195 [Rahnella sp. JUb53]
MDHDLDTLLNMHGTKYTYDCGYWFEIVAYQVEVTSSRPHGIRYSLTFHDHHNQRIYGMDNSHAVAPTKQGMYRGRIQEWDHLHQSISDKGTPYEFVNAAQLMEDFFSAIDKIIAGISE